MGTNSAIAVDDNATLATVMTISYSSKLTTEDPPATMTGLYDAITNAYHQHAVLFTASTGNQESPNFYSYPARFAEVIGVGGSGHSNEYQLNNYAPGNVELAAPAVDVRTVCKGGTIGEADGTSFATPQVAGAIMLIREEFPNISNDSVRARLRNTAAPMADSLRSGAGRLDVAAALGIPVPPPPPFTVSISGPSPVQPFSTCEYQALPQNGTPPFNYAWKADGVPVGDNSAFYWHNVGANSFSLEVMVTDAAAGGASGFKSVTVDAGAGACPLR